MKIVYFIIGFILTSTLGFAQGYQFGIVNTSGQDFTIVAIPDFDSAGNTDISDIGFTLVLNAGTADAVNPTDQLGGRTWTIDEFDAAFLTGQGLGDGSKDVFQFNLPPGQTELSHTNGEQIALVSFQVSNMPSGEMTFLLNSDPIAQGAGGVLDSFYNANIDNTSTRDYFAGIDPTLGTFMFPTLGLDQNRLDELQLYPNPVSEILYFRNIEALEGTVTLYDLSGKSLWTTGLRPEIEVGQLPNGLYLLQITTSDNETTTRKIIVE